MIVAPVFSRGSIFFGQHDREDAGRDCGVGRIRGSCLHRAVVVVDLPEAADAAFIDSAEVVFAMGIVVRGEGVEGANFL
jgi:hypothetical protein